MRNKFHITIKFFILLSISCNSIFCQNKNIKIATLDRKNAYDKKILFLSPKFDKKYYNKNTEEDSAFLNNGKFEFSMSKQADNFPRPYKFILELQRKQIYRYTESFYFDNKSKNIIFDSENGKIIDDNENTELKKQIFSYEKYMKNTIMQKKQLDSVKYASYKNNSFEKIKDSLKGKYEILKLKEQDLLYNYSKLNPNSIILFWEIVDRIEKDGYDKKYELIFNNLSKEIKQSFPGKILYNQFTILQENIEGNLFKFKINNTNITVSKKFTLIDFWFSHCKACLEEMPKYKSIYKKYKNNDFEIIGISTDRTNYIDDWKKVINEKDLPWLNLLDENSVEAQKYNINKFPTTFLLDKEGRIIKKDISPEELEKFLDENMKL